jgi:transcription termination/antitermination protein NusG
MMNYELGGHTHDPQWFAVSTRSRQEKTAATMLEAIGVQHFLPLRSELRQWSDRKQTTLVPLFSGYLFVCVNLSKDSTLEVLKVPGIVSFVRNQIGPLPIPEQQIEDIRTVLAAGARLSSQPHLKEGDRVRVVRGPLAGIEGILVRANSESRLLISIEMIRQSIGVSVLPEDVERIEVNSALSTHSAGYPRPSFAHLKN